MTMFNSRVEGIAIVALLLLSLLPTPALAQLTFSNVVDSTTSLPGESDAATNFSGASISGNSVALYGTFGNGNGAGIYTATLGQAGITKLADINDLAPEGFPYTGFTNPSIDGNRVGFSSGYQIQQATFGIGSYVGSVGATGPSKIFDSNDTVPGNRTFNSLPSLSLSGNNYVLSGSYSGGGGIYSGTRTGSGLALLADTTTTVPGHGLFTGVGSGVLSGSNVLFSGSYSGGTGIYSSTLGSAGVTEIVDHSSTAPGHGVFNSFSTMSLSGSNIAFHGLFTGGDGIYTGSVGVTGASLVADTTTVLPTVGRLQEFEGVSISGNEVAFTAYYSGGKGLYLESGNQITKILERGDALFGSTVLAVGLTSQGLDGNNVAFSYALANGVRGVGVASVPEPSASALLCAGVLFAGRSRRYRKRVEVA